jgi:hypothetical protein
LDPIKVEGVVFNALRVDAAMLPGICAGGEFLASPFATANLRSELQRMRSKGHAFQSIHLAPSDTHLKYARDPPQQTVATP